VLAADARLTERSRDAECVHLYRVAIRRLRSLLRTLAPLLEQGWSTELRDRLRALGDVLSRARDADVVVARIHRALAEVDAAARVQAGILLATLTSERAIAYQKIDEMRAQPAHGEILRLLGDARDGPAVLANRERFAVAAAPLARRAYRRLRKRVRRCGDEPSDERLHAVRRAAKHVRYALEALEPYWGRRARRLAKCVDAMQQLLGDEHDASVTASRLRAEQASEAAFAAGELAMVERRTVEHIRRRWRRSWHRLERHATKEGKGMLVC
jgi:CHAD domain-containing protein